MRKPRAGSLGAGLKILFATSEAAPVIKTGGLADVSHALPEALRRLGADVRVLMPAYPPVLERLVVTINLVGLDGLEPFPAAGLLYAELPGGVPLYLLDCPELFDRPGGPYQSVDGADWPDNAMRFGLLSRVAALLMGASSPLPWRPDILHCHDWQTGLAPAYLNFAEGRARPSVMTIHNLAYQGIFPPEWVGKLGLPPESFSIDGVEYYGNLSFMKAGLFFADHLTTVSPSYAREIQTEALGFGLQGLLATRAPSLTGILNGIDTAVWNPAKDENLAASYDARNLTRKGENKRALQTRMELEERDDLPLLALVSRFAQQKGVDLVIEAAQAMLALPAQIAMLGSGDTALEDACAELASRHPGRFGFQRGFDEALSHVIEGGADIFLMPSRFEPCGLNQMYSQRYGTPPVVHSTGGLIDSVVDATDATIADGTGSGFTFAPADPAAFFAAVERAVAAWKRKQVWRTIQRNGMRTDFSWEASARKYVEVYRSVVAAHVP